MKGKGLSIKTALLAAATGLMTLVAFVIYGAVYKYLDYMVVLSLATGVICMAIYAVADQKFLSFLNLVQVIVTTYGLGLFALNSHPVWADRLNNITMYGARGSLVPVIFIILLFLVTIFLGIISCFTGKETA